MNYKFFLMMIFSSCLIFPKNLFKGISEDSSVKKNNFLCPLSLHASGNVVCNDMDAAMRGFDISGGHTIQMFNNQQYWLQQKFERQQILVVHGQGDSLSSIMTQEGWDHMGAFSIILTTDPVILSCVKPEMVVAKGQIKLVAQLWYSGATGLQLWAQDVRLLNAGQNFTVFVSNSSSQAFEESSSVVSAGESSASLKKKKKSSSLQSSKSTSLPDLPNGSAATGTLIASTISDTVQTPTTLENFKQQFLDQIGFAPNFIDKNVYSTAYGSPRDIQIQVQ
jgi:hypothetical protein